MVATPKVVQVQLFNRYKRESCLDQGINISSMARDGRFQVGQRSPRFMDLSGQRFGRLVAIRPLEVGSNGMRWLFDCDCGRHHEAAGYHVRKGRINSCGCLGVELSRAPGGRRVGGYKRIPLDQRFWPKVVSAGPDHDCCWLWQGYCNEHGYGSIANEDGRLEYAHRLAWKLLRGEIPDGLVLDHLCRTPPCINPWHLDPVTQAENIRRSMPYRTRRVA